MWYDRPWNNKVKTWWTRYPRPIYWGGHWPCIVSPICVFLLYPLHQPKPIPCRPFFQQKLHNTHLSRRAYINTKKQQGGHYIVVPKDQDNIMKSKSRPNSTKNQDFHSTQGTCCLYFVSEIAKNVEVVHIWFEYVIYFSEMAKKGPWLEKVFKFTCLKRLEMGK